MPRLDYKLDDLDWSGFEQLIQTLLKARLGLGVEAWGGQGDWGRDAYFEGALKYPTDAQTEGSFVFQCKFIEGANAAGAQSAKPLLNAIRSECFRIKARLDVKKGGEIQSPTCYALFTNAPLPPATRSKVEKLIKGVLPDCKIRTHDGQDVCQWLRLSPQVAESFPQFHLHWTTVRRTGLAILAIAVVLGLIFAISWQREHRGQQQMIAGQINVNTRIASLEKRLCVEICG